MINNIINAEKYQNSVSEFLSSIRQGIPSAVFGVTEAFSNYLISLIPNKTLLVVKDRLVGVNACKQILEFSGKKAVYLPPKDQTLVFGKAFSKDSYFERLTALSKIKDADVIVCPIESLMQTCPKSIEKLVLKKDMNIDREKVVKFLVSMGYERGESTYSKGSFSVRGDLIDVFPINTETPFRIDFFDDQIESIKSFDGESRKIIGYVNSVEIIQSIEWTFSNDNLSKIRKTIKEELLNVKGEQAIRLRTHVEDLELSLEGNSVGDLSALSTLSNNSGSIFDYLDDSAVVVFYEGKATKDLLDLLEKEFIERWNSLYSAGEVFSFQKYNLLNIDDIINRIKKYTLSAMQSLSSVVKFFNPLKIINAKVGGIVSYQLDFKEIFNDIDNWLYSNYNVLVCCGDFKRASNFCLDLSDKGIASSIDGDLTLKGVKILSKPLSCGFIFHEQKLVVIGSGNLFNKTSNSKAKLSKKQGFFTAPEAGDYCVHETHGLGRVLGSKKITSTEGTKDYIAVEYHGGDILYVPVEQMDILSRYLGGERKPKLSKIGGEDFEKVKNRVRESIKKMSFDLKKLYSERNSVKGFAFSSDLELETAFNNAFPFEETPDQLTAEKEIKNDMLSDKVMDRLVCGDVGFGKTEVAFRAVFRAIENGKQVAMLAPTTILTEQHFNTAIQRFKGFGIKIACLNRFRTPKQKELILSDLKEGKLDFVIGTHRLLSKDVAFKDLGLLVLDEEQRFGVEHKERIKLMKKNVDTITLTATPIPRTLHMSLSGVRSISVINTPPKKRLPVQTYVTEETDALIKDAVLREVNRGGQAFILYNRVESINTFANSIQKLMPNLKIAVVHGQMEERILEKNVLDFYSGKFNLLISTTIIENGIDLPKANTLIVIDADRLGLSTLYQLKGRVGRSDRLAYAYFTFKREKVLTNTAYERLNAIIQFTEMGSGIKIAMRDLEIRGAGNVLGAEQHGHMDKIGYELYSKLLREEISGKEEKIPDLDVRVSAFIPEKYVESNSSRMGLYKEIAELDNVKEEEEFIKSTKDFYGEIPIEMQNLININSVKRASMKIGASKITINKNEVSISLDNFNVLGDKKLGNALNEFSNSVHLSMSNQPKIEFDRFGEDNYSMLKVIKEFLKIATE